MTGEPINSPCPVFIRFLKIGFFENSKFIFSPALKIPSPSQSELLTCFESLTCFEIGKANVCAVWVSSSGEQALNKGIGRQSVISYSRNGPYLVRRCGE